MPAPLIAAEVDLRDFQFMPMLISRLFGSEFHAKAKDSEWRAGVTLWLKSWHQVPAASVPNDDTALARLAEFGRDVKAWLKVKAVALYGWVLCSDDRWYHPTVADEALKAWSQKLEHNEKICNKTERQRRWRDHHKKLCEQLRDLGVRPPRGASMGVLQRLVSDSQRRTVGVSNFNVDASVDVYRDDVETDRTGTGTGTGILKSSTTSDKSDITPLRAKKTKPKDQAILQQAREILDYLNANTQSHYRPVPANLNLIVARLEDGFTPLEIRKVIFAKTNEWAEDDKMKNYLRPETLFNRTKFAGYAGQLAM